MIKEFNLAPTGTTNWGTNQCKNDVTTQDGHWRLMWSEWR